MHVLLYLTTKKLISIIQWKPGSRNLIIKAKKTHGFNSCIVISVTPLDMPSIKKATVRILFKYTVVIIDKLKS